MLFYEPLFLFLFLPTCYFVYLISGGRRRGPVLLVASVIFYLWSEPRFVPLVIVSALLDHVIGLAMVRAGLQSVRTRWLLAAGISANAGLLFYFKYAGFAVRNVDAVVGRLGHALLPLPAIALPVGVSFIVFEKITYLVDIRRGNSRPAPRIWTYLIYVFFFPKLLAGPIIKYHDMEAQLLSAGAFSMDDLAAGFGRFMLGVVKKSMLANTLATGADMVFAAGAGGLGFRGAWAGVLLFTLQIYFDFSAYSDMAIGIARMFGFRLRENFDKPYISCSITEFWRRWHISLSSWIREYLYIPLGGNRVPASRGLANLWICFLASGLWHGAAWTYVIWGAYNGLFLVLDKLFLVRLLARLPRVGANAITVLIVMVGWAVFRAASLPQADTILTAMLHPGLPDRVNGLYFSGDVQLAAIVGVAVCAAPRMPGFDRAAAAVTRTDLRRGALGSVVALLFVCSLGLAVAAPFKPFLYFRF